MGFFDFLRFGRLKKLAPNQLVQLNRQNPQQIRQGLYRDAQAPIRKIPFRPLKSMADIKILAEKEKGRRLEADVAKTELKRARQFQAAEETNKKLQGKILENQHKMKERLALNILRIKRRR